jgi:hypothetical protein
MSSDRPDAVSERRDAGHALADALLEQNRPLPALPAPAHARVKRRLAASLARRAPRRPRWLQPAVIASVWLLCGVASGIALDRWVIRQPPLPTAEEGAATATARPRTRPGRTRPTAPSPARAEENVPEIAAPAQQAASVPMSPPPAAQRSPGKRLALLPSPAGAAEPWPAPNQLPTIAPTVRPEPMPMPALPLPSEPAARFSPGSTDKPALPAAAAPTAVSAKSRPTGVDDFTEERLLAAALRSLRTQGDARSALAALDEYSLRYPEGRLSVEARVVRADALTALHRTDEALRALDGLDLAQTPGGLERGVQRGELRASAGRWQEAQADFDWVLAHARTHDGGVAERALWGRAGSRLRLGDPAGARTDAGEYVRRFPNGRFAEPAARLARDSQP